MSERIIFKQLPKDKPIHIEMINNNMNFQHSDPHRYECYEIVWALEGSGTHNIDFIRYPLNKDLVYFISPGQVHSDITINGQLCIIRFQPDFIESTYRGQIAIDRLFYQNKSTATKILLDEKGFRDLSDILRIMTQEHNEDIRDWGLISAMLNGFLRYSFRYIHDETKAETLIQQRMYSIYVLIDNHFRKHKKVNFYSEQLSITSKRANEISRQHSGKTITKILHDRIILESQRELAFTSKTIKQIAYELGYDDVTYFCRFFRKIVNESPLEFRKRMFK